MGELEYNLGENDVLLSDIVAFIATVINPNDASLNYRETRKRIRGAIQYAKNTSDSGKMSLYKLKEIIGNGKGAEVRIDRVPEFFYWAVHRWPVLSGVKNLPVATHKQYASCQIKLNAHVVPSDIVVPGDKSELENLYIKSELERKDLEGRLIEIEKTLIECQKELQEMKNREAKINKSKGRRVNW